MDQSRQGLQRNFRLSPGIVDEKQKAPENPDGHQPTRNFILRILPPPWSALHLLDLEAWNRHAIDNVGKQRDHVIVAHRHVGHNLLQGDLLRGKVLVLLVPKLELLAELRDLALFSLTIE